VPSTTSKGSESGKSTSTILVHPSSTIDRPDRIRIESERAEKEYDENRELNIMQK
jgi:hypothetical protein